jgi:quercetin 2,3-dioxygenase
VKAAGSGVYAFVLKGELQIADQLLSTRDGLSIVGAGSFSISAGSASEILLMEVPMEF